jgi:hypothetical protein
MPEQIRAATLLKPLYPQQIGSPSRALAKYLFTMTVENARFGFFRVVMKLLFSEWWGGESLAECIICRENPRSKAIQSTELLIDGAQSE